MERDKLFLLHPNFRDPEFPGTEFYCWECALMEGVLSVFPALNDRIDVERVDWQRPRVAVVDLLGTENQWLPVLILANEADAHLANGIAGDRHFVVGKDAILDALAERHGIPRRHP